MSIRYEISGYAFKLEDYIRRQSLPNEWFESPDHIAINVANTEHLDFLVEKISKGILGPDIEKIVPLEMDNRRTSIAFLAGAVAVGANWKFRMLKITESPPERDCKEKTGMEHMAFYHKFLSPIQHRLTTRGLLPELESRAGQNNLCLEFGSEAEPREVKFTDIPLSQVIKEEQAAGRSKVL